MSRSNPTENGIPNPAKRWFEWNGEHGVIRYYHKEAKQNVDVGSDFTFILLDQLGKIGGWHDETDSAIRSNQVKDTRQEVFVVRSYKGGTLAEGLYRNIKDKVKAIGGHFVANCYIAYRSDDGSLAMGVVDFKGAALHAWADFTGQHRSELYTKAIRINGYEEGKKGRIVYRTPKLSMKPISDEANNAAIALDAQLQEYLLAYLKRPTRERVDEDDVNDGVDYGPADAPNDPPPVAELTDDDIPF